MKSTELRTIEPARRVANVKEYYFSRKLREVAALNAQGRDIISLGIGGPDRMPADEVIEALKADAVRTDSHSYQPFGGITALRRAYADWYGRVYGVEVDPTTELQPLIGSKESVLHAVSYTHLSLPTKLEV